MDCGDVFDNFEDLIFLFLPMILDKRTRNKKQVNN